MPQNADAPTPDGPSSHAHSPVRIATVIGALGIVFGDIGTSPLYAFKEPLHVAMNGGVPVQTAVLGVLSLIFWALTLTISIKYIAFVLNADNDGEGGVLALITGMRLHKEKAMKGMRGFLLLAGLAGTAMLFGDGVLTPAISVLSAVEGVQVVAPSMQHWSIHAAIAVLIGIFMSQGLGTEKISRFYGPVVLVWFISIGLLGLVEIVKNPDVLAAVSPHYAWDLLVSHPLMASAIFGAIFLAVTGGEALYADLGHFGRNTIRAAWYFVAMPGLLLNYFGQGALVLFDASKAENPFYELSPDWFGIPLLVLATAATVVASQSIITGAFSLARQTIEIGYFPPMRVVVTSEKNTNHAYVSRLNYALMAVTLLVVAVFQTSSSLASAYGIAVSVAMMTTTLLFSAWMLQKSSWPKPVIWALCIAFLCFDSVFVVTNMAKVPDGGWLPLLMGGAVLLAMLSWHRGIEKLIERHMGYTEPITEFAARIAGAPMAAVHKVGVFFSRTGTMAPVPLERLTSALRIRFDKVVILSIRIASRPRVDILERMAITSIDESVIKIELAFGYLQTINIPATLGPALQKLGLDSDDLLYIIGHERVITPAEPDSLSDVMSVIFGFLAATAERSVDRFHLPSNRTLEIGYPVRV